MFSKSITLSLILFTSFVLKAQIGGVGTYAFLNRTSSARVAALGDKIAAGQDDDINYTFHNPALLNESMHNTATLNMVNYFAGIKYGYTGYAMKINDKIGTMSAGINYMNYGTFTAADEDGNKTGTFRAAEYAFNCIWAKQLDSNYTVGVNFKPLYSVLESYTSFGIAFDMGISYMSKDKLFNAGFVMRNAGMQLSKYYSGAQREKLPFDLQLGISKKLEYAPLRLYVTAHHLYRYDISYERKKEETILTQNNDLSVFEKMPEMLLHHMVFGMEFLPVKGFALRLGYNYQRRQDMKIEEKLAMVGFSWGFGINIKKIQLSYGRASYLVNHEASNHFSVTMNFSEMKRR